jgi:hypothetical protein
MEAVSLEGGGEGFVGRGRVAPRTYEQEEGRSKRRQPSDSVATRSE